MSFFKICPCHEPSMVGPLGALYFFKTHWTWQGTDVFLGSAFRTRGRKEKGWLLRYETIKVSPLRNRQFLLFLSLALILMGAW